MQEQTPSPSDYEVRHAVIMRMRDIVAHGLNFYSGLGVEPYGSFVSNLFTPTGDLDLAIEGAMVPQYEPC